MPIARTLALLSLVAVFIYGSSSSADDSELSRATLKGLTGVNVVVEDFDEVRQRAGFDRRTFQTDVELKLRMAGIKVLSEEEVAATSGRPWLYVNVNPLHRRSNETAAFSVSVEVIQRALLERDPSLPACRPTTWSRGSVAQGDISYVREWVKDLTDVFINAWLSVNPKE